MEDRVVVAAIAGDASAIEQVVDAWLPVVFAWCARLGAGRIDAEEAAHDVLMTLVRRHEHVDGPAALASWLFGTCRRVVANHRKRVWWRRWVPGVALDAWPGLTTADGDALARDRARTVARALDTLSDEHREVLVLCYLEDRSVAEAAALLGVPDGTVKSRLFHARAQFVRAYPPGEER